MKSIHDPRYAEIITHLRRIRKQRKITQQELVEKLGRPMSYLTKIETLERRLDLVELYDLLAAMGVGIDEFLEEIGWVKKK